MLIDFVRTWAYIAFVIHSGEHTPDSVDNWLQDALKCAFVLLCIQAHAKDIMKSQWEDQFKYNYAGKSKIGCVTRCFLLWVQIMPPHLKYMM